MTDLFRIEKKSLEYCAQYGIADDAPERAGIINAFCVSARLIKSHLTTANETIARLEREKADIRTSEREGWRYADELKQALATKEAELLACRAGVDSLKDQFDNGLRYDETLNQYCLVWTGKQLTEARERADALWVKFNPDAAIKAGAQS